MKKFFNSLFIAIAAMVVFAGCAKQEINEPAISETKTVQFYAESIGTKTAFGTPEDGTYPTLWSTSDAVKILVNLEEVKDTEKKVYVMCSDDLKSARFTAELVTPEADNFTFYSISPADALKGKSSDKGYIYVAIPTKQEPLTTSVDMAAQLLYASSETTETMPTSVELTYHHLTAYGKLSLTNLTPNVSSVSEIKLEAPEDVYIAGNWDYFVADGSFAVRSGKGSNSIVLLTTNTNDIWFACAPVDMSGKKMTLTVTTDKGDLKKEITFPEDRKFKAGKISKFTVDMAGIEVDTPEDPEVVSAYYEKVTSDLADWSGTYLMVCTSKSMALSGISTTSTKYGIGSEVTIEDNKIAATDELASSQIVISPSSSTKDAYLLAFNGSYLSWTSGNSLNVSDEDNTNSNWKITVSDANVSISNCKDDTRKIVWNASSPRFACYTTAQTAIQLYKLVENEGGEEPETKTLVSITISGQTTTYTVGDTFEFDGTVTATYSDGTTATVTPTSVSEPDMDVEGTKDVTVTYTEGGVTKETTYQINVSAADNTDYSGTYAIVAYRNSESLYYYLTNEQTSSSTVRLVAKSAGNTRPADGVTLNASKLWNVSKSGSVYTIQSAASNKYVSWESENSAIMSETGLQFTITKQDDGTFNFINGDRYLSLNSAKDSDYFAMYAGTQTQNLYLIKAVEGEEPAPTLTKIDVKGQTKTFTVGDTFKFDGTVTATYSDKTTATVTPTSVSEPDMDAEGTKDVTVTYTEGGVTVETTYQITIKEKPAEGDPVWTLVTDASSLAVGDQVVIVAKESNYALSTTQNENNRGQASVVKSDQIITFGNDVQVLTLEAGTASGTFAFNTGSGYLYAASSSKNYLRTETTLSANSSWSVTIAADGTATVVAKGSNTRNTMQYNQSSLIFACYSSASQKAIALYKLQ